MMSAARAQPLLASGSVLVCTAALLLGAPPTLAQGKGPSDRPSSAVPDGVKRLWSEYPVNPERLSGSSAQTSLGARREERQSSPAAEERDSSAAPPLETIALMLAAVLGAVGILAVVFAHERATGAALDREPPTVTKAAKTSRRAAAKPRVFEPRQGWARTRRRVLITPYVRELTYYVIVALLLGTGAGFVCAQLLR